MMMRDFEVDIAGLFEGMGGLTLAVQQVLGGRLGWYSEYEPPTEKNPRPTNAAAKLLAYHYPDAPNLGDIMEINWGIAPRPRILTGGFPCQDVSAAGKRAGLNPNSRSGLWVHMAKAIDVLRPELVVIENVRGLLSAAAVMDALFPRPERRTRMLKPVEPPVTTRQYVTFQTTGELL